MIFTAIETERRKANRKDKMMQHHAEILLAENHLWELRKQSEKLLKGFVYA
jgi:hypothetical protein